MSAGEVTTRDLVAAKWNLVEEFNLLLGEGRATTRRCFNKDKHRSDDKTPALSFNPRTGAWMCHACHEKGDFFTLRRRLLNESFGQTMEYLLRKYGLWEELGRAARPRHPKDEAPGPTDAGHKRSLILLNREAHEMWKRGCQTLMRTPEYMWFLRERYGLTEQTVLDAYLGHDAKHHRLIIPVWGMLTGMMMDAEGVKVKGTHPIVNLRQHDYLRKACSWYDTASGETRRACPKEVTLQAIAKQDYAPWVPKWDGRFGKVISVAEHGMAWVYPYQVLLEQPAVYVVGGELKALLMNQCGLPAVAFTGGEGKVAYPVLPMFVGKSVRVLMDPDAAGVAGAETVAALLANTGASVELGIWPEAITERLPLKGDITDYLRMVEYQAEEAMRYLEWRKVEADEVSGSIPLTDAPVVQEHKWEDFETMPITELLNPRTVGKWNLVKGVPIGRSGKTYVVPHEIRWSCPWGEANEIALCRKCALPDTGHKKQFFPTQEQQLGWMNLGTDMIRRQAREVGHIPKCAYLKEDTFYAAAETVLLTTPVDVEIDPAEVEDGKQYEYLAHSVVIIQPGDRIQLRDNVGYDFGLQTVADPKSSRLTAAVVQYRSSTSDVFHFNFQGVQHDRLRRHFDPDYLGYDGTWGQHLVSLTNQVTRIHESEGMLATALLTMFAPFRFNLFNEPNQRICPVSLILGDTTVGKSTIIKHLIAHYGVGRFKSMDAHPTFAGLVGGNQQVGGEMLFHWGVLPASDGSFIGLDELNKMKVEDIGALTAMISSGKAERTTVNGDRSTRCFVRMCGLANPRGARPLRSLDPYEALKDVIGTVQDLGRLEWAHVQMPTKNIDAFFQPSFQHDSKWDYRRDLARYHISWAWSRKPSQIKFSDEAQFKATVRNIIHTWGHTDLMRPAMARWKVARLSIAIAMANYSTSDGDMVIVLPEHVRMAQVFYDQRYAPILQSAESFTRLPEEIIIALDQTNPIKGLSTLLSMGKFTRDDVLAMLPRTDGNLLLVLLHRNGVLNLQQGYYRIREPQQEDLLREYLVTRARAESTPDREPSNGSDLFRGE